MKTLIYSIFAFLLGAFAVFYFRSPDKGINCTKYIKSIVEKVDTIYKNNTYIKYVKGSDIKKDTTIYIQVPADIDTMSILKSYYAKNVYKDTFEFKDGVIYVYDTISMNSITYRKYFTNINSKEVNKTMYIEKKLKYTFFAGLGIGVDMNKNINQFSTNIFMETPKRKLYGIGVSSTPNGNVSIKGNILIKL